MLQPVHNNESHDVPWLSRYKSLMRGHIPSLCALDAEEAPEVLDIGLRA